MRFLIETYGCSQNHGEAALLARSLADAGHVPVMRPDDSDCAILFTCAVIQSTENRMLHRLDALRREGKPVVVAGCMASARAAAVRKRCPAAHLIPPSRLMEAVRNADCVLPNDGRPGNPQSKIQNPHSMVIPIADGCAGRCTFCITRVARGGLRSRPEEFVVSEMERAVAAGAFEMRLSAPDTAAYGKDIGGSLPALLERVCAVDGDFMLRVGMLSPASLMRISDCGLRIADDAPENPKSKIQNPKFAFIEAFAHPKVFRFLHLPLQSGSDAILIRMARDHSVDDFLRIVAAFRARFPDLTLSTDVIAGFPGEGEEEFGATLRLIGETRPDIVNIKGFSARPGTPAARMKGRVPPDTIKERTRALTVLKTRIGLENGKRWVGREVEVLVTEVTAKGVMGRTMEYRPVAFVNPQSAIQNPQLGRRVRVEIAGATASYLIGRVVS